jgi:hypothetical protein
MTRLGTSYLHTFGTSECNHLASAALGSTAGLQQRAAVQQRAVVRQKNERCGSAAVQPCSMAAALGDTRVQRRSAAALQPHMALDGAR